MPSVLAKTGENRGYQIRITFNKFQRIYVVTTCFLSAENWSYIRDGDKVKFLTLKEALTYVAQHYS